jgi:cystathionine beta-synthase
LEYAISKIEVTAEVNALVLAKVETFNPGNSVKDRMAVK